MEEDEENYDLIFKLILIGDSGVGKTNILSRYINNEFSFSTQSTVGVEFGSKFIKKNDKIIKLQIWDTAGQERYKSITTAYYNGSRGAFIVYDISRRTSFENIDKWIDELKTNGSEDITIILVGNKSDLSDKREVKTEEVERKSKQYKIAFCETSALNGNNIEKAFDLLIKEITKNVEKNKISEFTNFGNSKPITLESKESIDEEVKKGKDKNKDELRCC